MELKVLFTVAFLVEAIWQALKPLWPRRLKELEKEEGISVDSIGSLALSLLLCFGARVNLLEMVGVNIAIPYIGPYIGMALTAFLVYRGGNFLHDAIQALNGIKNNQNPVPWSEAGAGDLSEPVDLDIGGGR